MVAKKYNIPIGNDIRKFIISDVKKETPIWRLILLKLKNINLLLLGSSDLTIDCKCRFRQS